MMRACWEEHPDDRPSFLALRQWLEDMMQDCSGVQYLDMELNHTKEYYTCRTSRSSTDTSMVEDDASLPPMSSLLGTDIDPGTETVTGEEEQVALATAPERKLASPVGEDPLMNTPSIDVIIHKACTPTVSVAASSASSSASSADGCPPSQSVKNVRFSHEAEVVSDSARLLEGQGESWHDGHASQFDSRCPQLEGEAWNSVCEAETESESEACSPVPSPDLRSDEVFTLDAKDKEWPKPGLLPARHGGPPRALPQERHPCGLFRVSLLSNTSSTSEDLVMPLMSRVRASALDSQGESVYTSSSSGESFSLPLTQQELFHGALSSSSRIDPAALFGSTEHGYRPLTLNLPTAMQVRNKSVVKRGQEGRQASWFKRRSQKEARLQEPKRLELRTASGLLRKTEARSSAVVLKRADRKFFKDARHPIVFTKTVATSSAELPSMWDL